MAEIKTQEPLVGEGWKYFTLPFVISMTTIIVQIVMLARFVQENYKQTNAAEAARHLYTQQEQAVKQQMEILQTQEARQKDLSIQSTKRQVDLWSEQIEFYKTQNDLLKKQIKQLDADEKRRQEDIVYRQKELADRQEEFVRRKKLDELEQELLQQKIQLLKR